MCPDYEWPNAWGLMSDEERQRYFMQFRVRLQAFWQAQAEYEKRRAERVDNFRTDETFK